MAKATRAERKEVRRGSNSGQIFPPPLQAELKLTPEQKKELDAIRMDLKTKLEKLLTDEQKKTVENFRPRFPGGLGGPNDKGGRDPMGDAKGSKDGPPEKGSQRPNRPPIEK